MTARAQTKEGVSALKLSLAVAAIIAPVGLQMPFLPLWFVSVGLTAEQIAIIQGATPVARFLSNLTIPPLADRMRRPAILVALCLAVLCCAFIAMGFAQNFLGVFALMALCAIAQGPAFSIGDAIVLREARRRLPAHERPLDYSAVRGAGSLSVLALMIAGGWILAYVSAAQIPFAIAATVAASILPVLFFSPNEPREPGAGALSVARRPLERPALIALVIGAAALVQSSHADLYSFGSIGFRELGFGPEEIGLLWAIGVGAEVAFFMVLGKKFGGARSAYGFLIFGAACATARWSMMAFASGGLALAGLQCLHSGSFAATHLGSVYAVAQLIGEDRRAQGQGWLAGAVALAIAFVSLLCGVLWEHLGPLSYLVMAGVAGFAFFLTVWAHALSQRLRLKSDNQPARSH